MTECFHRNGFTEFYGFADELTAMDSRREAALLQYIGAVWNENVTDLLDLKDGNFFLHVLDLIDQCCQDKSQIVTSKDKIFYVKRFLQDFYGAEVCLDDYLNFETVVSESEVPQSKVTVELAKIAVVLLGIGVLDQNGQVFMESALELPAEVQGDVLAMIQSVVVPGSTEVVLTDRIEAVLCGAEVSEEFSDVIEMCDSKPFESMEDSENISPKKALFKTADTPNETCKLRRPLRTNAALLNCSFQDITSPFKSLDIKSPSSYTSPLAEFVQSPQLIQKAVLKQKELEIRKLREELNAEVLFREETQLSLHDSQMETAQKDVEMAKLHRRIGDLLGFQESYNELQDLKQQYSVMEEEVKMLRGTVKSLEAHIDNIEKENSSLTEAMAISRQEDKSQCRYCTEAEETILSLERQNKEQQMHQQDLESSYSSCKESLAKLQEDFQIMRGLRDKHKSDLESLEAKQCDSTANVGESMGVVLDIQMGELKCELETVRTERDSLLEQLESSKQAVQNLKEQVENQTQNLKTIKETNTSLSSALTIERDTNVKMKKRMDSFVSKYNDAVIKLENSQKDKQKQATEIAKLTEALRDSSRLLEDCRKRLDCVQSRQSTMADSLDHDIKHPSNVDSSPDSQEVIGSPSSFSPQITGLSSGYDSSMSSPNITVLLRGDDNGCADKEDSISETRSLASSYRTTRSSTVSLQSIQSIKELLPGVLPNALSCANEPDDQDFEWDKLSLLSLTENRNMNKSSSQGASPGKGKGKMKLSKKRTPKKRGSSDDCDTDMPGPAKQRKSGGTVKYFPLDPDGPIYPPPRTTAQRRSRFGRFIQTSSPDLTSETASQSSSTKLKPGSSPQKHNKNTPAKRSSHKLRHFIK